MVAGSNSDRAEHTLRFVEYIFRAHGRECIGVRKLAAEVSSLIDAFCPLIMRHTSGVCPSFKDVCCRNRHFRYAFDDVVYLSALGERMPPRSKDAAAPAPCQYLGDKGCMIRHSLRPYRCTWFFCSPLLEEIESGSAGEYRQFIELMQEITRKRNALLSAFARAAKMTGTAVPL